MRKIADNQNTSKFDERMQKGGKDGDTGYHLEIGVQSQKEHKEKSELFRKDMMDTLDMQLRQKDEQQKKTKLKNQ